MAPPSNPGNPSEWRKKAVKLGLDPVRLDLTAHQSHSASKFTETDFIHLKALWKNREVTSFNVSEYVRAEHVQAWDFVVGRGGKQVDHPLRQCLAEFIRTSVDPFTDDDEKNVRLGAFLLVKSNLEAIRGINNEGQSVGGDLPKIRRSARIMTKNKDAVTSLAQQLDSMVIDATSSQRAITPLQLPPRTPSPKAETGSKQEGLATGDLAVISPESMALENNRSRDEDSVNAALVSLLETVTLCSGIKKMGLRHGLRWHHTRQAFRLGPANSPVCEARTDGLLVLGGDPERCLAILEVKPYLRDYNVMKIEWQEACQMAAWISSTLAEKTTQKRSEGLLHTGDSAKKRYV